MGARDNGATIDNMEQSLNTRRKICLWVGTRLWSLTSPQLQGNAAAMAPTRRCKAGRCASPHGARTQLTGMAKLGGSATGLSAGATDLAADAAGLDGGATELGSDVTVGSLALP